MSLCERIANRMETLFQFEHLLEEHIKHEDFRVRLALLRHPYCSIKYVHKFLDDPAWQVLTLIAERKDLPEEYYRYLYKYKRGIHSYLDFALDQHALKKVIGIDSEGENPK